MKNSRILTRMVAPGAVAAVLAIATPAYAQTAADFAEMRAEMASLRAEQARSSERIAYLEGELARARTGGQVAVAQPVPAAVAATPSAAPVQIAAAAQDVSPAAPINPAGGSAPGAAPVSAKSKLAINGDVRVRYEANSGDDDARDRHRGVLRARLRALYTFSPTLAIGAQIGTGDGDDPNSTDITLASFNDDLEASLDQVYVRLTSGNFTVYGGKFPQQFVRTEMVFDGDVSPQGLAASYKFDAGHGTSLTARGLYFLIDEATGGPDSHMIGGQATFESALSPDLKVEASAGYYDYRLASLAGGDTGDFRSNRFAGGRYLSDFNLLDVVGAVQYNGLGELWPVRVVGDYVHNFGATTDGDTGFGVDVLFGRASKKGDWRFSYGYAQTDVDAVLTAFSHDNTNIASNYYQHTLAVDYVPMSNVVLNMTYYRYRPKDALFAGSNRFDDWLDRVRLNFLVTF